MYNIEIVTEKIPDGIVGEAYYAVLKAETFPQTDQIEWECRNSLPQGLEIDSRTGILSGIATEYFLGTITIWATRTDSNLSCYKRFMLYIRKGEKPAEKLRIIEIEHFQLKMGINCSIQLKAEGGTPPYKWKAENLPVGMQLLDGKIIGVPALGGGKFPLQITIEDKEGKTDSYFCWLQVD